ncbi:MAG: hypothetical protein KZQ64_07420 [gamma proteobacterium symbiont of Bathyaustriella thionipta]|nr:hypothetical protein [gamma proteobacterium symbiont of Bathyaustriella thionipta]MCU7951338.1 hypothetical protein [gamma proteobacterium symbiont of Bathyaustriella thionipta]MCU7953200.1 hypothetical protein [gamma proteobacterium symbiont of Bathyaustriella thionipta]MCU7957889.1 hypothetical protein [gamma proteobacterium symbiont of Bathyaustriella thionipta]MCU7968886.1 hypothetical protein [gamma proteobacterium symbiont of Bathyaustriella thionipta]
MNSTARDPISLLTVFVLIGFIISIVVFAENTKTPLEIDDQPQHLLANNL